MGTNYTDNRAVMDFTLREVSQLISGVTARKPGFNLNSAQQQ